MSQGEGDRLSVGIHEISEGKFFAKKMHRFVKKLQAKPEPLDALEVLSEMARRKGENLSIPIEVETEAQWTNLLKREGLIVVDVYSGWSGPCSSMFSILRKLKLDTNDDRLIMAAANADNIAQLGPFRNQSEPCWLFVEGGKPVKVLRGSNAPKLVKTIKLEFNHELECIKGNAKRELISIKFEASRREHAVTEAIALNELMALEEEEKKARMNAPSKSPTPVEEEEKEEEVSQVKEKSPAAMLMAEEEDENEEEEEEDNVDSKAEEERVIAEAEAQAIIERRRLMEASNVVLKETLRPYMVIAIQAYLLETGAVTEIKDYLSEDFNLIRERYISFTEDDARKLFDIPAEIPDPNPPPGSVNLSDAEDNSEAHDKSSNAGDETVCKSKAASVSHSPVPSEIADDKSEGKDIPNEEECEEEDEENQGSKKEKTPIRMMAVPVPEVLIGDTLILLLECTKVKPLVKKETEEDAVGEDEIDFNADYYMLKRTGPDKYEVAVETQPESLHAMYGKEKYVAGVWCPRTYEDKRFVMLNYFPQFVTEMLMPPVPDQPKYQIFVFSALFTSDILEHPEYGSLKDDVISFGRTRIPHKIAKKMLIASKREGDFLKALKWALTGTEVLIISINGRNEKLTHLLESFEPIFSTNDNFEAGYFTGVLFKNIEVLIDGDPFPIQEEDQPSAPAPFLANLVGTIKDTVAQWKGQEEKSVDSEVEKENGVSCENNADYGKDNMEENGSKLEDKIENTSEERNETINGETGDDHK